MKKSVILFQAKHSPGPLDNEKPRSDRYYNGLRENFKYFPWGLLSVGSALKEKYDVTILDQRFDDDWRDTVTKIVKAGDVLFAGVTGCTGYEIKGGLEFSKLVRSVDASVPIVWGGWHASTVPDQTIASEYVDIVVRGQGEWTVMELAERLQSGTRDLSGIRGLTYKIGEGQVVNEPDREIRPAEETPDRDYSMVNVDRYLRFKDGSPARLFYISSLGCPFKCTFCSIASVYQRHFSSKSPATVIREVKYFVENHGVRSLEFDGTIFFVNKTWSKAVMQGLIDSGLDVDCVTTTRADLVLGWDDEMKDLIKRARFKVIGVGAESGSQRILDLIDKRIKVEDIPRSLEVLKDLDVDPCYTFMFGLPGETMEDSKKTLDLMVRLRKIMPECRTVGLFYHPFPGSQMYEEYKALHKIPDLTLEEWASYSFDLKYTKSLSLNYDFLEYFKKRLQYFEWAFPEDDSGHSRLRRIFTRMARLRVMNGVYALPLEWRLARSLGKVAFD